MGILTPPDNDIEFREELLPLADLKAQGRPGRFLRLFTDFVKVLSWPVGQSPTGPRWMQMDNAGNIKAVAAPSGTPLAANLNQVSGNPIGGANAVPVQNYNANNQIEPAGCLRAIMLPSAAVTAAGNTAPLSVGQYTEALIMATLSAISGTAPTLTLTLQVSPDGGSTWGALQTLQTNLSGAGTYSATVVGAQGHAFGDTVRVAWTVGGTAPSFTVAIVGLFK